jgi:hypothetical protein
MSYTVSTILPPDIVAALRYAAALGDVVLIDQITDRLAADGIVRSRGDMSRMAELQAQCSRVRPA